jgi:putative glutamine amidotransferase
MELILRCHFCVTCAVLHIATWIETGALPAFERVFAAYPGVMLWNARVGMAPSRPDGLLLTGGDDIAAEFLRQPVPDPSVIMNPLPDRDAWEFYIVEQMLARRRPILAICRGLQVLNVALGGTLILDMAGHANSANENIQPLVYADGAKIRFPQVNSSHHQALGELGEGLVVEARHAGDGTIEQVRHAKQPFVLGVQFHPERDVLYRPLFDAFIAAMQNAGA